MATGLKGLAGYLWLLLLPLLGAHLLAAEEEVLLQVEFVQRSLSSSEKGPGEYMFDWGGDEIFHVDEEHMETIWRLPYLRNFIIFEPVDAVADLAILHFNLDICMHRSNYTPAPNVPPKVTLYPENPVELGEPNVLICLANEFLPPVITLTWLKNGQVVKATEETDFYPSTDFTFRRFSYLAFVPNTQDIYYCRVEHRGLQKPLTRAWSKKRLSSSSIDMAEPLPETGANVVCGLGLAVGIVGITVGTIFFIKGRRENNKASFHQGPM